MRWSHSCVREYHFQDFNATQCHRHIIHIRLQIQFLFKKWVTEKRLVPQHAFEKASVYKPKPRLMSISSQKLKHPMLNSECRIMTSYQKRDKQANRKWKRLIWVWRFLNKIHNFDCFCSVGYISSSRSTTAFLNIAGGG